MKPLKRLCKKTAIILTVALLYTILVLNCLSALHPGGRRGESNIFLSAKTALPFLLIIPEALLIRYISIHSKYKQLLIGFIAYSLLFTLVAFLALKPTFVADAGEVRGIALYLKNNVGYVQAYPNNLGYLSLLRILVHLPIRHEISMLCINFLCFMLAIYSLLKICNIFSFGEDIKKTLLLIVAAFLPFYMQILFFYNDLLGIGFSFLAIAQALSWRQNSNIKNVFLLILSVYLMLFFRQNTLIPLIAIIIYFVFTTTKKSLLKSLLIAAACLSAAFIVPSSLKLFYSKAYGFDFKNGNNAPAISFIAMASMDSVETRFGVAGAAVNIPGWWNAYNLYCPLELKENCDNDAKELLKRQLSAYINSPKRGLLFVCKKIASQWADATFLLPYAFINEPTVDNSLITKEKVYYLACEIIHLIIIVFSIVGIKRIKKMSWENLLPLIALFGYFLFSLIWEAKSRYIMLVFPLLLPFAAYGLSITKPTRLLASLGRKTQKN